MSINSNSEGQESNTRLPPMDEVPQALRVLYKTRAAHDYHDLVSHSTAADHGAAVEAAILVVVKLRVQHAAAYSRYLQGGGTPGNQNRSKACVDAEIALFTGWNIIAAILAVLYPPPTGINPHPIFETRALIDRRAGPICNGWNEHATITHHPHETCPVHGAQHAKGPE